MFTLGLCLEHECVVSSLNFEVRQNMAEEAGKLTLRRLEAPIQKFIKVAIPTDLERLQHHQNNIEKVNTCIYKF